VATVGVLPASGKSSRVGGIPKFCLPISDERSLLQWHVEQMLEVCDEVRISTRLEWAPIIENMDMNVKIIIKDPSTMSDAVKFLIGDYNDTVVIGMPDTFVLNSQKNIYKEVLKEDKSDVTLGVFNCSEELKGRVGQVLVSTDGRVIESKDKVVGCDHEDLWGIMVLRKNMIRYLDPTKDHPGKQIQDWIDDRLSIKSVRIEGKYMDVGTLQGLKNLYREMDK
jgi:GTP:adenosylcobinamide-phosphate guanylyltransferase